METANGGENNLNTILEFGKVDLIDGNVSFGAQRRRRRSRSLDIFGEYQSDKGQMTNELGFANGSLNNNRSAAKVQRSGKPREKKRREPEIIALLTRC